MNSEVPSYIERNRLPSAFPTHAHSSEFWEQLGRTIGTFGFLEEMLVKAIFALTATRTYPESEAEAAYINWQKTLEKALSDTLVPLARNYGKALKDHPFNTEEIAHIDELVEMIECAADTRTCCSANLQCHRHGDAERNPVSRF